MIELCSEYLSVWCIWLYVLVMSCTSFRVNPHSDSDFVNSHSSFFRYRVWIHSERCMWHDKYIQSNAPYRRTDNYSEHSSIIWPVWLNSWVLVHELSGSGFKSSCRHLNFRFCACFEQGVPWLSGTIECGFTLKGVCDMTRTYSQMHCTDKYSEHSSIILASLAKWLSVVFMN